VQTFVRLYFYALIISTMAGLVVSATMHLMGRRNLLRPVLVLRQFLFLTAGIVGLVLFNAAVLDPFYVFLFMSVTLIASVYLVEIIRRVCEKKRRSNRTA
jgi:hypothetical protein